MWSQNIYTSEYIKQLAVNTIERYFPKLLEITKKMAIQTQEIIH